MMTKQEEIREGMAKYLKNKEACEIDWNWEFADEILSYLHSQGVVVKVDRELPDCPIPVPQATMDDAYNRGYERGFKVGVIEMLENAIKAGYVAVEPLVEEE